MPGTAQRQSSSAESQCATGDKVSPPGIHCVVVGSHSECETIYCFVVFASVQGANAAGARWDGWAWMTVAMVTGGYRVLTLLGKTCRGWALAGLRAHLLNLLLRRGGSKEFGEGVTGIVLGSLVAGCADLGGEPRRILAPETAEAEEIAGRAIC